MILEILDPTHEGDAREFQAAPRLQELAGTRVGIISNGKQGTGRFFDAFEKALTEQGVGQVIRLTKANYSAPAEPAIMAEVSQLDAVVSGIGD